jgi:hypothetical protein
MMQATNDVIAAILPRGRLGALGVALLILAIESVSWPAAHFAEHARYWPSRAWTSSLNMV